MTAGFKLGGCQLQIDLGLAGPSDTPEQQSPALRNGPKKSDHRLLLVSQ